MTLLNLYNIGFLGSLTSPAPPVDPSWIGGGYVAQSAPDDPAFIGMGGTIWKLDGLDLFAPVVEDATLRNYSCWVESNASSGSADELRIHINESDGNGAISIPVATTGAFQDTTNTDSISQGDDLMWHFVEGTTQDVVIKSMGFEVV